MKNTPSLWMDKFPIPKEHDHKYSRGQVVVLGAKDMTGAACLTAGAASRLGAGLVTIIAPDDQSFQIYRSFEPHIIVRRYIDIVDFTKDAKLKARVCPAVGMGIGDEDYGSLRRIVLSLLCNNDSMVIDADGLNAFAGRCDMLFSNLHKNIVLTPHDGEFSRLFGDITAKQAAVISNAVIVKKGYKTVIASPDGREVINKNAAPYLATAGSGDVLSGVISSLMAQGMSGFDAACAGVFIHGRASQMLGIGLVAGDLIKIFPKVLKEMLGIYKKLG